MGFFDNLDDEAGVDFLYRVESTQKGLQNLTEGEHVVPLQSTQGLEKEPVVEDDEVDFFKEFALEDFDEMQQTYNAQPNVSSKTKTNSGGLPSLDVELDVSDVTEISSKKDAPIPTQRLEESNTQSKGSRVKNQSSCPEDKGHQKMTEKISSTAPVEAPGLCSLHQKGVLETIEEESGVEDTTQASEKTEGVITNNASESKAGQEFDAESQPIADESPDITTNQIQQTPNHDQEKEKINKVIPTQDKAESRPFTSNKKTSVDARRASPLPKLTLLAPKKAQELFPLKRPRSRTKSPKPLLTKTSKPSIQASQKVTTNPTLGNLVKDKSTHLLSRKKQCTQLGDQSVQSQQQKSTADPPTPDQEPSLPIPETLTQQGVAKLVSNETPILMDLACNKEHSPDPVPVISLAKEESPELESPDFNSTTKELEFMMLDAKIVEDQLLETTVRLAIQANKLMRLDNPLINEKLAKLNKEAEELLKPT